MTASSRSAQKKKYRTQKQAELLLKILTAAAPYLELQFVCLFGCFFFQRTEERCSFKSQLVKCQHSHNRKLWQPHSRGSQTLSSSSSSVIENLSKKKCFFWILQYVGHVGMQGIRRIEKIFHWGYQVKNKSLSKMHCLMYTQFIEAHLIVSCVVLTNTGGCSLYHHGILITF